MTVALMLSGCQAGGITGPEAALDEPFGIRVGEEVVLDDGAVTVAFLDVTEDSRCPVDAVCVWQGDARLVLVVTARGVPRVASLHTAGPPVGPREIVVDGYTVSLLGLEPQPRIGRSIPLTAYAAVLRVSRATATAAAAVVP